MKHDTKNHTMKTRRGVSQIIGSLIVLAIVASVGSIILFQGLGQINSFNHDLTFYDEQKNQELREDVFVSHVRFIQGTDDLEIYVSNIGTVEATISSITMVHNESQELLLAWEAPNPIATIQVDDNVMIPMSATLACPAPCVTPEWDDPHYFDEEYKISLTTSRGNFIPADASPWNT